LWYNFKCQHKEEIEKDSSFVKNAYMLYSTVSSCILKSIAEVEGFMCEDVIFAFFVIFFSCIGKLCNEMKFFQTLTGFKWMGNRAHDLIKDNKHVLFSFEEVN